MSREEIQKIHSQGTSQIGRVYVQDDGTKYLGIVEGRLQIIPDYTQNTGPSEIINKPELSTVANTGSYLDLVDIPNNFNKETEVDFGNGLYQVMKVFTVLDSDVTPDSKIIPQKSIKRTSNGREPDEIYVETLDISAQAQSGYFNLYVRSLVGSISGQFIINYSL